MQPVHNDEDDEVERIVSVDEDSQAVVEIDQEEAAKEIMEFGG